jgi:hypothetical protein
VLSQAFFVQFLLFVYAFATMISIGSVLQEEITYKRYNDWLDVALLVSYCFLEHFPNRQLHMPWRLQCLWQYLRGDNVWRPLTRNGLVRSYPIGLPHCSSPRVCVFRLCTCFHRLQLPRLSHPEARPSETDYTSHQKAGESQTWFFALPSVGFIEFGRSHLWPVGLDCHLIPFCFTTVLVISSKRLLSGSVIWLTA